MQRRLLRPLLILHFIGLTALLFSRLFATNNLGHIPPINTLVSSPSSNHGHLNSTTPPPSEPELSKLFSGVAVFLETRPSDRLSNIIDHFLGALPSDWKMQLYHSKNNAAFIKASEPIENHLRSGRLLLTELPEWIKIASVREYSMFLSCDTWFWKEAAAEHILLVQGDSAICKTNTPWSPNNFTQFDYIGAPWLGGTGLGGNGGFSMRSRAKMLWCVKNWPYEPRYGNRTTAVFGEDGYFTNCVRETGGRVSNRREGMTFSVETLYDLSLKPFAVHKPWKHFDTEQFKAIEAYCPEVRLAMRPGSAPLAVKAPE